MAEIDSLDPKTIVQLQELLGDEYLTVYKAYIGSTEQYLSELEAAVGQNDAERIKTIAHTLKGSSANIGAVRFSQICQSLMDEVKIKTRSDLRVRLEEINHEYQKVHDLIMALFHAK